MRLKIITAPATEPVSLTEAKAHLRVDGTTDDTLISSLIVTARQTVENYLGRALITQALEMWMDTAPSGYIVDIPMPPLISVTSIKYYQDDGVAVTFSSGNYIVAAGGGGVGRVALKTGQTWPSSLRPMDAFVIAYSAGYGAAADVPDQIKNGILKLVNTYYENREDTVVGTISTEIERSSKFLLDPYRVLSI